MVSGDVPYNLLTTALVCLSSVLVHNLCSPYRHLIHGGDASAILGEGKYDTKEEIEEERERERET